MQTSSKYKLFEEFRNLMFFSIGLYLTPNSRTSVHYRAFSFIKSDFNGGGKQVVNIVSESLRERLKGASILADVVHSDHCPVVVEID